MPNQYQGHGSATISKANNEITLDTLHACFLSSWITPIWKIKSHHNHRIVCNGRTTNP